QSLLLVKPRITNPRSTVQEVQLYDRNEDRYVALIRNDVDTAAGSFGKLAFNNSGEWLIGVVVRYPPTYSTTVYKWSVADLIQNEITQYNDGQLIWDSRSSNVIDLRAVNNQIVIASRSSETYEQTIEVVDLVDDTVQETLQSTYGIVHPLTGDLIAFETTNGDTWTLVNVSSNEILGTLADFGGSVKNVVFDAGETRMLSVNQHIAANAIEVFVHLRSTTTWESISALQLADQVETLIGFQPDGRPIVVSAVGWQEGSEKRVDIWDVESGEILHSFQVASSPFIALS